MSIDTKESLLRTPAPWGIAILRAVSSPVGRWARVALGPLIVIGALLAGGPSLILAPIGILMTVTGVFNLCPAGPLLGRPLKGEALVLSFDRVDAVRRRAGVVRDTRDVRP